MILEVLEKHVCSQQALAELERKAREALATKIEQYAGSTKDLAKQLADCDRRIANYYLAIGNGMDLAICRQHIAALEERKAELRRKADLARREDLHRQAIGATVAEVRRFGEMFRSGFESRPMTLQRRMVLHFVDRIDIIDRKKFRVTLRAPVDGGSEIKSLTSGEPGMQNGSQGSESGGSDRGDGGVFARRGKGGATRMRLHR